MLNKVFFTTIFILSFLGPYMSTMIPSAQAEVLIDCEPTLGGGGDLISRAFYIPSYPGNTLSRVDVWLRPNAPGTYTLSLVASAKAFDGTQIGAANVTATLNDTQNYTPTSFTFSPTPVAPGSLIAFKLSKVSGPEAAVTFLVDTSGGCPVIETADSTPPLSDFRKNGIPIKLYGDPAQALSWQGDVSFPIKTTSASHEDPENVKFLKSTLPFAGSVRILTAAKELVPDERGCYVALNGGDGTKICIKDLATVGSSSKRSKTNQLLIRGTGLITTTIEWVPYTGIVYLDATGTLKLDASGELTSIGLKGKIGGGADFGFVFDGTFSASLNR